MFIIIASMGSVQVGFFGPYASFYSAKMAAKKIRKDFEKTTDQFVVLTIKELVNEVADLD